MLELKATPSARVKPRPGLPFVLMRGGTSKGVFLRADHVPVDRNALSALLLDLFGSPDRRQIDGLGGADKLTSKAAVMGAPTRPDADIDYLFAQVGTEAAEVDYRLNCGNLTAAAAVYAIEEGWVEAVSPVTRVRVHNVNTACVILADVPVNDDGSVPWQGGLHIDGVPGQGSPIVLDFAAAAGPVTGRLLPLGSARSRLSVPGWGEVEVTVVDGANLVVFVEASALGLQGDETPERIDGDRGLVDRIDALRAVVAEATGLGDHWRARRTPSSPFCVLVAPPWSYRALGSGEAIDASAFDLLVRQYSTGATSKALAATVASVTGIAARIPGSVVHQALGEGAHDRASHALGHPCGLLHVEAALQPHAAGAAGPLPRVARIERTARRLAEGRACLKGMHPGTAMEARA